MSHTLHSFDPIVDDTCRLLILGTMPGEESLRRQQYYGHPRNAFWPIVAALCNTPLPERYAARTEMLLRAGIALWDVCQSCQRAGSLDSNIRQEQPNPIDTLLARYPSIRAVCFNGQAAARLYRRHFRKLDKGIETITLPSTSPAHTMPFDQKLDSWRTLLRHARHADQ